VSSGFVDHRFWRLNASCRAVPVGGNRAKVEVEAFYPSVDEVLQPGVVLQLQLKINMDKLNEVITL
jgi:hypothetical protein